MVDEHLKCKVNTTLSTPLGGVSQRLMREVEEHLKSKVNTTLSTPPLSRWLAAGRVEQHPKCNKPNDIVDTWTQDLKTSQSYGQETRPKDTRKLF
jgi:hypothetical protein